MRKMSKNRTEDDTVSSTNGSVKADGEIANGGPSSDAEADKEPNEKRKEASTDDTADESADENTGNDEDSRLPRDPPKKRVAKTRTKETKKPESEDEKEYEVEEILDSKRIGGKLHYLIHWKGWSSADDSWEPADTVSCSELIKKFEENEKKSAKKVVKRKAADSTKGRPKKTVKIAKKAKLSKTKTNKEDFDYEHADKDAEYEVERILEVHHKKTGKREFLIHWKGWSSRHDSWEPEEHLNCSDLIKKFMGKVSAAREKDSRELRVAPESTRRFTLAQTSSGRRLSKRSNQRQRVRYDNAE